MDGDRTAQNYVAPLQIRKPSKNDGYMDESKDRIHLQDDDYPPRSKFQNFLRASYPFHSTTTSSPSTVTLELNAGDIILVHSIHTNGWADGTLLTSGARGWLPTNYCEGYDYGAMRPLLKALTEFWDIIRSGDELDEALFHNHDYMRGIVAGVRFLLEKSDCLTRESQWVKQYDPIRRIRKALLADLSNLVKSAKHMQQTAIGETNFNGIGELLDDMLLKAFKVVTRAVSFFDVWSEEIASRQPELSALQEQQQQQQLGESLFVPDLETVNNHDTKITSLLSPRQQSLRQLTEEQTSRKRPTSTSSRRQTLTHRMSLTGRRSRGFNGNLASEQLSFTFDAFLGVLASFLGSHMQSRSSSELLLITQLAVKACRKLLTVVEMVIEHEPDHASALREAKDMMCDRISDLVEAAKQVFRPLQTADDDVVYLPSEGMQLVNAATACVSGAGKCVSKARSILEDTGDFEIELSQSACSSPLEAKSSETVEHSQPNDSSLDSNEPYERPHEKPRLAIATLEIPRAVQELETAISETNPFWTPAEHGDPSFAADKSLQSSSNTVPQSATSSRPYSRDVYHNTGSQTTLISSVRDSGPSFVSDSSTRATSPDKNMRQKCLPSDPENLSVPENEDLSDGENEVMEQTYAHELLINSEGRVIGGTLNAIVEKLTAHDSTPESIFVSTIYLTFRLFASPAEFAQALIYRYRYVDRTPRIVDVVRLRVVNVLKGWLEAHWRDECDAAALPFIQDFVQNVLLVVAPTTGQRLLVLIQTIIDRRAIPSLRASPVLGKHSNAFVNNPDQVVPQPVISKTQLALLRSRTAGVPGVGVVDFDPLEIARQITIKESHMFCSILPEELLSTEFTKQSSSLAVNVRAMAQLSTDLANLVADSILQLDEVKKRAATIKHWIKIAKKCLELNNYDTLMAIVCSINSSTILRLKKTWDHLNQKTKNAFDELKKVVDVSKNYSSLRQRVAAHTAPCLPFVGMYLTDLTFVDHGNSSTRQLRTGSEEMSVINLDKHMKTAKIVSDLQRFQIPYQLAEVSELQTWLHDELVRVRAAGERNFQNHYRRSLLLEPRETPQSRPTTMSALSSMASITSHKDKFDFLGWTQFGRDKTASVTS